MAISLLGANTGTNTCTVTAHSVGDLILVLAFRTGSNSTPTVPAGYTAIQSVTSNSAGSVMAYKIATATNDTSGTWTNGTNMAIAVYTGTDGTTPIGGSAVSTNIGTTVTYPALTMTDVSGNSWVAGLGTHRSTNTTIDVAPTGMTNRANAAIAGEISFNDTNGGVSSWSAVSPSVGGTSSGWGCYTVELLATGAASQNIAATGLASTATIGAPTVALDGAGIIATGLGSTATLGSPTLSPGAVTISPTGLSSTATIGSPAVTGGLLISPTGKASTASIGAPTLSPGAVSISPTGRASTLTIGSPAVSAPASSGISPTGRASTLTIGSPLVFAFIDSTPIRGSIHSGNTSSSVTGGNRVEDLETGGIMEAVISGTKNDDISSGTPQTTITTSRTGIGI